MTEKKKTDGPVPFKSEELDRINANARVTIRSNAQEVAATVLPIWNSKLNRSKKDEGARDIIFNARQILTLDPNFAGRLRLNTFAFCVECKDMPWSKGSGWHDWHEDDALMFADWAQQRDVVLRPSQCAQAARIVAKNNPVDPLIEYLSGLVWDGVPRLDTWMADYCQAARNEYVSTVGRKFMISLMARGMTPDMPGSKVDHVLVLEGAQGVGKTSLAEILAGRPEFFTSDLANLDSKDAMIGLLSKWVVELAELAAVRRAQVEQVKTFLTKKFDWYRPPYEKGNVNVVRRCGYIATTNVHEYLTDETGGRRFWGVVVGSIDLVGLAAVVEQLHAEAMYYFQAGEKWYLSGDIIATVETEQDSRIVTDVWDEKVQVYLDNLQFDMVSIDDVLTHGIRLGSEKWDEIVKKRIGRILKRLKWTRERKRINRMLLWRYFRPIRPRPDLSPLCSAVTGNSAEPKSPDISMAVPVSPSVPVKNGLSGRANCTGGLDSLGAKKDGDSGDTGTKSPPRNPIEPRGFLED